MSKIVFCLCLIFGSYFNNQDKTSYTETEKIDILIRSVENLKDAKFYRNGAYHSASESANHLRMKLNKAGSRIITAEDFIEKIASRSYLSGEKYRIIFSDGKEMDSRDFFYLILRNIE